MAKGRITTRHTIVDKTLHRKRN